MLFPEAAHAEASPAAAAVMDALRQHWQSPNGAEVTPAGAGYRIRVDGSHPVTVWLHESDNHIVVVSRYGISDALSPYPEPTPLALVGMRDAARRLPKDPPRHAATFIAHRIGAPRLRPELPSLRETLKRR